VRLGAVVVLGMLALASAARAEGSSAAPASGSAGKPAAAQDRRSADQLRKEVLERMRALRAFKIVDELKLDETASARLFPILARYDDREMALSSERHDIVRELKVELAAAKPDNGRVEKIVDRLLANRTRRHALHDEQFKELRKVLTPVQQGKLALLLPRLERDFARFVHQVAERPGERSD
jgi:Spy/CpxP family protein refolding chaperone